MVTVGKPRKLRVVSSKGRLLTLRWSSKHRRYLFAPSNRRSTGPTGWIWRRKT